MPDDDLDSDAQMDLYRIVQESLRNVFEHSQAETVQLEVVVRRSELHLNISDHGVGFDPEMARGRRMGLIGLRERAIGLNGTLEVKSSPGSGTQILAQFPLGALSREPDESVSFWSPA